MQEQELLYQVLADAGPKPTLLSALHAFDRVVSANNLSKTSELATFAYRDLLRWGRQRETSLWTSFYTKYPSQRSSSVLPSSPPKPNVQEDGGKLSVNDLEDSPVVCPNPPSFDEKNAANFFSHIKQTNNENKCPPNALNDFSVKLPTLNDFHRKSKLTSPQLTLSFSFCQKRLKKKAWAAFKIFRTALERNKKAKIQAGKLLCKRVVKEWKGMIGWDKKNRKAYEFVINSCLNKHFEAWAKFYLIQIRTKLSKRIANRYFKKKMWKYWTLARKENKKEEKADTLRKRTCLRNSFEQWTSFSFIHIKKKLSKRIAYKFFTQKLWKGWVTSTKSIKARKNACEVLRRSRLSLYFRSWTAFSAIQSRRIVSKKIADKLFLKKVTEHWRDTTLNLKHKKSAHAAAFSLIQTAFMKDFSLPVVFEAWVNFYLKKNQTLLQKQTASFFYTSRFMSWSFQCLVYSSKLQRQTTNLFHNKIIECYKTQTYKLSDGKRMKDFFLKRLNKPFREWRLTALRLSTCKEILQDSLSRKATSSKKKLFISWKSFYIKKRNLEVILQDYSEQTQNKAKITTLKKWLFSFKTKLSRNAQKQQSQDFYVQKTTTKFIKKWIEKYCIRAKKEYLSHLSQKFLFSRLLSKFWILWRKNYFKNIKLEYTSSKVLSIRDAETALKVLIAWKRLTPLLRHRNNNNERAAYSYAFNLARKALNGWGDTIKQNKYNYLTNTCFYKWKKAFDVNKKLKRGLEKLRQIDDKCELFIPFMTWKKIYSKDKEEWKLFSKTVLFIAREYKECAFWEWTTFYKKKLRRRNCGNIRNEYLKGLTLKAWRTAVHKLKHKKECLNTIKTNKVERLRKSSIESWKEFVKYKKETRYCAEYMKEYRRAKIIEEWKKITEYKNTRAIKEEHAHGILQILKKRKVFEVLKSYLERKIKKMENIEAAEYFYSTSWSKMLFEEWKLHSNLIKNKQNMKEIALQSYLTYLKSKSFQGWTDMLLVSREKYIQSLKTAENSRTRFLLDKSFCALRLNSSISQQNKQKTDEVHQSLASLKLLSSFKRWNDYVSLTKQSRANEQSKIIKHASNRSRIILRAWRRISKKPCRSYPYLFFFASYKMLKLYPYQQSSYASFIPQVFRVRNLSLFQSANTHCLEFALKAIFTAWKKDSIDYTEKKRLFFVSRKRSVLKAWRETNRRIMWSRYAIGMNTLKNKRKTASKVLKAWNKYSNKTAYLQSAFEEFTHPDLLLAKILRKWNQVSFTQKKVKGFLETRKRKMFVKMREVCFTLGQKQKVILNASAHYEGYLKFRAVRAWKSWFTNKLQAQIREGENLIKAVNFWKERTVVKAFDGWCEITTHFSKSYLHALFQAWKNYSRQSSSLRKYLHECKLPNRYLLPVSSLNN